MWIVISFCDKAAEKCIQLIRGHEIVAAASHLLDKLSIQTTVILDSLIKAKAPKLYDRAPEEDSESSEDIPDITRLPDITRARKFRRKYVLPRRKLTKRSDDDWHWEQIIAGEIY